MQVDAFEASLVTDSWSMDKGPCIKGTGQFNYKIFYANDRPARSWKLASHFNGSYKRRNMPGPFAGRPMQRL